MKTTRNFLSLSRVLCTVLIAALALFALVGCGNDAKTPAADSGNPTDDTKDTATEVPPQTLGEGGTAFTFLVVDKDGNRTEFRILTDKETVGDALLELGLISGEDGAYGLYVKTVNGITADYDVDGRYWAFYENGAFAMSGIDKTKITPNTVYEMRVES